ncbi:MAG: hypothetical protein ACRDOO_29285 [Actinomadura sp.]
MTAAGPVGLALVGILFSSVTPADPATVAPTPTPTPSADPTPVPTASPSSSPTPSPTPTVSPTAITSRGTTSHATRSHGFGEPSCEVRSIFKIRANSSRDFWIPGTHFVDGPGGEIKVWIEREHNVETSLLLEKEARLEFDFKSFIAEVRKMVSPIITTRIRVELGHEYLRPISKGKYGHVRYRVFGYKISFWQWRQYGNCSIRFVGTGLASLPTRKQGWKYWETKRP